MRKPIFNRKNLKKFNANLYHETRGGYVHYLPLCHGTLSRPNGEVHHCALGELYEHFVGPTTRLATKKEKLNMASSDGHVERGEHITIVHLITDADAASALSAAARMQKKTSKSKLSYALVSEVPTTNDSAHTYLRGPVGPVNPDSEEAQIARAQAVQEKLNEIADGFLI